MLFLNSIYAIASLLLALYGLNSLIFVYVHLRCRSAQASPLGCSQFPPVTVQLPVYNEQYVVTRALDSLVQLRWPPGQLQIQVLDDSTDETVELIQRYVQDRCSRESAIDILHRQQRAGFKAGALNAAMTSARGEFIAIFDADFCPRPDFLEQTIPYLLADPDLGFVQTRWGHLNAEHSILTLAQALALDGHFAVEHIAREKAGWLTNFSGTAGVWRKRCLEECGAWDPRMLTEDIELSYRAQLAGWKGLTLRDIVSPAELPVHLSSFMRQQFRWAKGNTQCFVKVVRALLQSTRLSWMAKLQGILHTSYYAAHPLMLIVIILALPMILYGSPGSWVLALLSVATLGPLAVYALGQLALYPNWLSRLRALPVLVCLGTGMAFNSTIAVFEVVLSIPSPFERTPKFGIEDRLQPDRPHPYPRPAKRSFLGEVLLTLYSALTVVAAVKAGSYQVVPFLLLYVAGFGLVSTIGLWQSRTERFRDPDP